MGVELSTEAVVEEPVVGQDAADRLLPLWHVLMAGTLAVPTAITLLFDDLAAADRVAVASVVAGFALWHWFLLVRNAAWMQRTAPVVLYWVGALAAVAVLVDIGDSYTITLYGLFPLAFITLGWWGIVPVVAVTAVVGWRLDQFTAGPGGVINLLATAALSTGIAVVMFAVDRQNRERREALVALAAARAELAGTARRAGVLEERQRMARELHDTVAQGFTSIVTHLEAAEQALDTQPGTARAHLGTARSTARDGLTEVRRTVAALRPDLLETASLGQALERTVRRWSAESAVAAEVRCTGVPVAMRPDAEAALLRTAQEALTNVARHARATRAVVTLSYLGDAVTLDVDDDGIGLGAAVAPSTGGGFGLPGMRERIAAVGGRLDVESAPGEGTTIAATVPA